MVWDVVIYVCVLMNVMQFFFLWECDNSFALSHKSSDHPPSSTLWWLLWYVVNFFPHTISRFMFISFGLALGWHLHYEEGETRYCTNMHHNVTFHSTCYCIFVIMHMKNSQQQYYNNNGIFFWLQSNIINKFAYMMGPS